MYIVLQLMTSVHAADDVHDKSFNHVTYIFLYIFKINFRLMTV